MKSGVSALILVFGLLCSTLAAGRNGAFSFGVVAQPFTGGSEEAELSDAITAADQDNLAFVVANGIKANDEPCSDAVYNRRKALLGEVKNGLIVSLAASDWAECKRADGRSAAMERLNRVRDMFFSDDYSFGASKLPLSRQSAMRKFRSNGENTRWEFGNILFATINLPADNNHYLPDAGRNSEFEDRAIANRDWLIRLFKVATRKKLKAVVLFCDGDPLRIPSAAALAEMPGRRDGFLEVRKQLLALTGKYTGRVLVVHAQPDGSGTPARIAWKGNLGKLEAGSGWMKLTADPSSPRLFSVRAEPDLAGNSR
jgi:hypothetical protein